jgi:hypothetical protein
MPDLPQASGGGRVGRDPGAREQRAQTPALKSHHRLCFSPSSDRWFFYTASVALPPRVDEITQPDLPAPPTRHHQDHKLRPRPSLGDFGDGDWGKIGAALLWGARAVPILLRSSVRTMQSCSTVREIGKAVFRIRFASKHFGRETFARCVTMPREFPSGAWR